jgi:hypothetical protein
MCIYPGRFLFLKNKFRSDFMYETYSTPSWETEWIPKIKSKYECEYCGCGLDNHEVFLVGGKPFCGCCK